MHLVIIIHVKISHIYNFKNIYLHLQLINILTVMLCYKPSMCWTSVLCLHVCKQYLFLAAGYIDI